MEQQAFSPDITPAPAPVEASAPAPMTPEQAQEVLQQANTAKLRACQQEVDQVLKKHGCALDLTMTLGSNGIAPRIRIVPSTSAIEA